jgi:hypothetical protein
MQAKNWEVYAQPACGGPEQVLDYLGRYMHRVAFVFDTLKEHHPARF